MRPQGYLWSLPFYTLTLECLPANKRKSGEGGIRTHEAALRRLRDFQSRSLGQLGHLSSYKNSLPDGVREAASLQLLLLTLGVFLCPPAFVGAGGCVAQREGNEEKKCQG